MKTILKPFALFLVLALSLNSCQQYNNANYNNDISAASRNMLDINASITNPSTTQEFDEAIDKAIAIFTQGIEDVESVEPIQNDEGFRQAALIYYKQGLSYYSSNLLTKRAHAYIKDKSTGNLSAAEIHECQEMDNDFINAGNTFIEKQKAFAKKVGLELKY